MIKVCHLSSVHPTFDIRIFHKECCSLVRSGFNVSLIAPANKTEVKDGVNIVPIALPSSRLLRMMLVSFLMFKLAHKQKAQLYHFHDPELILCGLLLRMTGAKVIFDIHENVALSIVSKKWLPKSIRFIIKHLYSFGEKLVLPFFSALVFAEDSYRNYYSHKNAVVVLNYPLLLANINLCKKDFVTPIHFVYTGGISEERGLWEMLALVKKLNTSGLESKLSLVGTIWSGELKKQLVKFVNDNDLNKHITLVGKVPFEEVKNYLKNADIGLALLHPIPNYVESLPTKIFEYMQFGLPFILSDFPLYKNYVNRSDAGICVGVMDLNGEFNNIYDWLKDNAELKRMSENGPKKVFSEFNWGHEEKKLLKLYHKLLS